MRLFTMYRRNVPTETHDENQRNAADEPQFQGVVFDDGRVSVRWLTAKRSVSVWDNVEDMLAIHGHPEYGSEMVWHDAPSVQPQPSWVRVYGYEEAVKHCGAEAIQWKGEGVYCIAGNSFYALKLEPPSEVSGAIEVTDE